MIKWGMVIDLRRCIGCKACAFICKDTNRLPLNTWRSVIDCGIGEHPERLRMFTHITCMHCSKPSCVDVCPTKATYLRHDGIVDIQYDKCIGCGYCIVACPYRARSIFTKEFDFEVKHTTAVSNNDNFDRVGICTKCNFCLPRIDSGLALGKKPGVDPEASPSCMICCSSKALSFGDLNDPSSTVSKLIRENRTVRLQEQLGTEPSIHFIIYENFFQDKNKK